MKQICDELQCPNICFVGDFNAGVTNTSGAHVRGLLDVKWFHHLRLYSPGHIYIHK